MYDVICYVGVITYLLQILFVPLNSILRKRKMITFGSSLSLAYTHTQTHTRTHAHTLDTILPADFYYRQHIYIYLCVRFAPGNQHELVSLGRLVNTSSRREDTLFIEADTSICTE